jgi:Flp pilus assembly protein TadD
MPKARHFAPPLVVLFLGWTALSGVAQAGWFDSDKPAPAPVPVKEVSKGNLSTPAQSLDQSILQAQALRLAGNYPEAVKHLSQLMMVAADDPRVVSEYGKTLAQMGRPSEAVDFLTRAAQLQPTDWTLFSALGVAYDQSGNQDQAKVAYEHALALKPGEPSVLNNYALSRLLAKDTDMARSLAGRAEIANAGGNDDKIARNIAMIRSMAPEKAAEPNVAAIKPAPVAQNFAPAPQQPLPHAVPQPPAQKVTQAALPAPAPTPASTSASTTAQGGSGVVMQRVPVDPLAGPVQGTAKAGPVASHAPRPLQPAVKTEIPKSDIAKAEAPKIPAKSEPAKALPAKPAETAKTQVKLETPAKPKAEITVAKPDAAKPVVKLDLAAKNEPAKSVPIVKPAAEPKVLAPAPVKAAAAKPANAKADPKADKAAIPGLRLSANAY